MTFTDLGIEPDMVEALAAKGIIEPFPMTPAPDPVAVLIGPQLDLEKLRSRLRTLAFGSGATSLPLASAKPVRPR